MISSVKDMLKNRPPRLACFLAFADLTYLVWTLLTHFSVAVASRFVISAVLWWFVFKGRKLAGDLLGGCCALSAFLSLALVKDMASASMVAAVVAMSIPVSLGGLAAYFLFGSSMRKFQNRVAEKV
jgi:hypothetical protein